MGVEWQDVEEGLEWEKVEQSLGWETGLEKLLLLEREEVQKSLEWKIGLEKLPLMHQTLSRKVLIASEKDLEKQLLLPHEVPNQRRARSKPPLRQSCQAWAGARRPGYPPARASADDFES